MSCIMNSTEMFCKIARTLKERVLCSEVFGWYQFTPYHQDKAEEDKAYQFIKSVVDLNLHAYNVRYNEEHDEEQLKAYTPTYAQIKSERPLTDMQLFTALGSVIYQCSEDIDKERKPVLEQLESLKSLLGGYIIRTRLKDEYEKATAHAYTL